MLVCGCGTSRPAAAEESPEADEKGAAAPEEEVVPEVVSRPLVVAHDPARVCASAGGAL